MDAKELGRRYVHPVSPDDARDIAGDIYGQTGITLRQHFAGLAMQGVLSSGLVHAPVDVAKDAVTFADALLAELAREQ